MDLILPNYSLFIQIANFLILLLLLNFILYRPIRRILNQRKEEMNTSRDTAEDLRQRAHRFSVELEENMNETRKFGLSEKEAIKNKGLEEEREMLQRVNSSIEEKLSNKRKDIQEKLANAQQTLQAEVDGFSRELAEKILGRGI